MKKVFRPIRGHYNKVFITHLFYYDKARVINGLDSVVSTATHCRVDGPGFKPRRGKVFRSPEAHKTSYKWVLCPFPGGKGSEA